MPVFEYDPNNPTGPHNLAPIDFSSFPSISMEIMAEYNEAGTLVEVWQVDPMDPQTPGYVREAWRQMRGEVLRERERAELRAGDSDAG